VDGHLYINDISICQVSENLGEWKLEIYKNIENGEITGVDDAMFVCSKRYIETDEEAGINNIRCAGVPSVYKKDMTIDDIVVGGTVLVNKKCRTETGIILNQIKKSMEFQKNIYRTSTGTAVTEDYYFEGDCIKDMYGRETVIEEVVYKTKEKRNFNLI
jgi:hypothetical protein